MKYLEILQFNPIVDVIQFNRLSERDYQLDALHNFVYPDYFLETILPEFVKNMVFGGHDQKGIQVIGSYGTGKSHLMGLVQLVAENADNLAELRNEQAREIMQPIAGKFMVHRFELDKAHVLAGKSYQVRLLDVNRKELVQKNVSTNEFGHYLK